jgi:alkanesulfonate monooxygenase SsuD/methylene tetrahydromethanopterin reductase-like flavin-dependent oxidoreductase (luciferase family)
VLAQTVSTIDIASNGRFIAGLGAGEAMNLEPVGIPWDKPVSRMAECIPLLKRLWTERYVDHEGKYYRMENAIVEPKPVQDPHPPIWLAANGPRTLKMTGEHCQGWLPGAIPPDVYADDIDIIKEAAKNAGADWSKFEPGLWINTSVAESREQAKEYIETSARMIALYMSHRLKRTGVDVPTEHSFLKHTVDDKSTEDLIRSAEKVAFDDVEKTVIYGTVDDCIEQIGEFVDAGARHFVVGSRNPPEHQDRFWDGYEKEIIPSFK